MTRNNNEPNDDALIDDQNAIGDDAANNGVSDDTANGNGGTAQNEPVEFAGMSERERALVEKARGEEKRKLYAKQKKQDERIKELERQIREVQNAPAPTTQAGQRSRDEKIDALIETMNSLVAGQRELGNRIDSMQTQEVQRRQRAELDRYIAQKIAEVRRAGDDVIESLVTGDSEEEIDEMVKIARAEWLLAVQKDREKRGDKRGQQPSSVTVQSQRRPSGAPNPQTPNTVEADNHESIDELVSESAVRSGDYEKNRNQILSGLKRRFKYGGTQPSA